MHYELSSLGTVLILAVLDKMYWTTAKQQQHRTMDALRAPADDVLVADWLRDMGKAMQAEDKWVRFAEALIKDSAAVTIKLLRQLRDADVDKALDEWGVGPNAEKMDEEAAAKKDAGPQLPDLKDLKLPGDLKLPDVDLKLPKLPDIKLPWD